MCRFHLCVMKGSGDHLQGLVQDFFGDIERGSESDDGPRVECPAQKHSVIQTGFHDLFSD